MCLFKINIYVEKILSTCFKQNAYIASYFAQEGKTRVPPTGNIGTVEAAVAALTAVPLEPGGARAACLERDARLSV